MLLQLDRPQKAVGTSGLRPDTSILVFYFSHQRNFTFNFSVQAVQLMQLLQLTYGLFYDKNLLFMRNLVKPSVIPQN